MNPKKLAAASALSLGLGLVVTGVAPGTAPTASAAQYSAFFKNGTTCAHAVGDKIRTLRARNPNVIIQSSSCTYGNWTVGGKGFIGQVTWR